MKRPKIARGVAMLFFGAFASCAIHAQVSGGGFSVVGHAIGGVGFSAGGQFSLAGSIGVGDGGSGSGSFTLNSGPAEFFTTAVGNFDLEILLSGGSYRISWPAEAFGYVLEQSTTVGVGANWQPVSPAPTENTYSGLAAPKAFFFRLHRP
jgi:hypothetical protein